MNKRRHDRINFTKGAWAACWQRDNQVDELIKGLRNYFYDFLAFMTCIAEFEFSD